MPFHQAGPIRFYTFSSFSAFPEMFHAVLTRHGGSSPAPWDSLNFGGTVGDNPETVVHNKQRALEAMQRSPDLVFDVWQVHGRDVVRATTPRLKHERQQQADIILSNQPQLTLLMRFADCVPILLYDPRHKALGLAHAGWLGTVRKAAEAAVKGMNTEFGTEPAEIFAAIGPSIGPDHYQVGDDVVSQVRAVFGDEADSLLHSVDGGTNLDLWEANRILLIQAGVNHIEQAGICTACHIEDWYSHRGERGKTGRFGVMMGLQ